MNQPFHQGSYQQRYTQMGDEAESHFEKNNTAWVRYGLNRPDFQVHRLPHHIRYTPDYLQGDPVRLAGLPCLGQMLQPLEVLHAVLTQPFEQLVRLLVKCQSFVLLFAPALVARRSCFA